jgi:hypothetical protein
MKKLREHIEAIKEFDATDWILNICSLILVLLLIFMIAFLICGICGIIPTENISEASNAHTPHIIPMPNGGVVIV